MEKLNVTKILRRPQGFVRGLPVTAGGVASLAVDREVMVLENRRSRSWPSNGASKPIPSACSEKDDIMTQHHFPALTEVKRQIRRVLDEIGPDLKAASPSQYQELKRLNERAEELAGLGAKACGTESGDGARPYQLGEGVDRRGSSSIAEGTRNWAAETAAKLARTATDRGIKALTSGQVDAPQMVRTGLFTMPTNPARLLDLIVDRIQIPGNEYEYLRQTTRTDNAAAVADNATKPTSVYTVTSIQDRARVYAHLSEAVPLRIFADHKDIEQFLATEMARGVLDRLESDIVSGAAAQENVTGILNTAGIGITAFTTSPLITLRKARTAMEAAHEEPTAWVLHPNDAEVLDLTTTADGEFVVDSSGYANVFGTIPKVISTSVPAGTALLADWRQCSLYVREDTTLDADRSGVLFEKNQVKLRAEGRFGWAVNRPAAFRTIDLAA
ncbi:phage major capsid protein [Streptomyces sp. NPDC048248]|uniref:phage major capsid protein n=1 Tax=Streptomyces sp. NPDC048248 TaxID=3365523 RepID=UPI003715E1E1